MNFGDCNKCQQYKFLDEDGCCTSCSEVDVKVTLRVSRIHPHIVTPEVLDKVSATMKSRPHIEYLSQDGVPGVQDESLDIGPHSCALYQCRERYDYDQQPGNTRAARIASALDKAYNKVLDEYITED